ncbi:hypothetical protein KL921_004377 [Ogataea angusta]|uniref:Vacuolar protein sorting-associated protein 55 n=1 Tax=Pichia angusta TaxID=870730 RepID=A0ABQ7RTH7_PICAN|nr:hypothetical protein KL921_004377 [Ogataea angusta]KAG7837876.1 hypothetical protein KL942_004288 [Ogataea angusta]KAG7843980.1 hypothetical protein KL941_004462 [Ogataea angusta]KAG7847325.1 hypothetical protein KL940_004071 [Ogataea angusta]
MPIKLNPLTKIIGLSSVLAVGFLLVVLAGALYGNWLPVLDAFVFAIAHIPILITRYYASEYDSYLDDAELGATGDVVDFGRFLSSFLLVTGIAFPVILYHCHILTHIATQFTIYGGLLIYGVVVTFTSYFDGVETDALEF